MIEKTFVFLKGISYKTERKLWSKGILSWQQFINSDIKLKHKEEYDLQLRQALKNLHLENSRYFANLLRLKDNWRLYDYFKQDSIFLDIEVVGRKIVLIGIYDNFDYYPFVLGYNFDLALIRSMLSKAKLLVTFNGASFDIPRLSQVLSLNLKELPIFDIRFTLLSFGLKGTLKEIEEKLNISRNKNVKSVDVHYLWNNFIYNKDKEALKRLISYNFEDTYNLKLLAEKTYTLLEDKTLNS
ncbi:MAG: uncharacterized protein PWP03_608 [Candidatus Woesearchaeota archaeon]|nr:uncharacterized protein [Candidatus Woesearchaeota archaeon]MDN5327970.1 uncharacterized protein [Candidatus Woesearchaeota archaeon]